MSTSTVRVHKRTQEAISRLSKRRGKSTADLLDEVISRYEEEELLAEMNRAYARTRSDPDAWQAERRERGAWEATLGDGLGEL